MTFRNRAGWCDNRLNDEIGRSGHKRGRIDRISWLRAAVLGANDGILSVASLVVGVAAGNADHHHVLMTGVAGLVAGGMSMAAGEYISVHSQADTEDAELKREREELKADPVAERHELSAIYVERGVAQPLADKVASQLMARDALSAHARDELGIIEGHRAKPLQAALASAVSFATGAMLPLIVITLAPVQYLILWVAAISLVSLALLGFTAAYAGGANLWVGALRVSFWGASAMAVTAATGVLFRSGD